MTINKKSPYIILLIVILCLAFFFEIAPLLGGNVNYFHKSLWWQTYENPLFGTACLGSVFAYWMLLPFQKREFIVSLTIGAVVEAVLIKYRLAIIGPVGQILHIGPGLLTGAIMAILWRIFTNLKEHNSNALNKCLEVLSLSISMPILLSLGSSVVGFDLRVYDPYLYALDSLWGSQISFIISRFLSSSLIWRLPMYIIYFYLSLYMVFAQIAVYKLNEKHGYSHWNFLIPAVFFILIAICGSFSYSFLPAVGVELYCGTNSFPNGPWPAANMNPVPIEAPYYLLRNCMPSLHFSWILAVYYSLYRSKPIYRQVALLLVFLTVLSTFSVGCHYLIDLIMAVPFTMALLAITMPEAKKKTRLIGAIFGLASFSGWLCLFKYSITTALQHPTLTLTLLIATDLISFYLAHLMCQQAKKTDLPELPQQQSDIGQDSRQETPEKAEIEGQLTAQ